MLSCLKATPIWWASNEPSDRQENLEAADKDSEPLKNDLDLWFFAARLFCLCIHFCPGLNNLVGLYYTQGKYTEAESLYKQALAISEKALGSEHSDVATIFNNIAELYRAQGKYAQAELLCQQSVVISEKTLGNEEVIRVIR